MRIQSKFGARDEWNEFASCMRPAGHIFVTTGLGQRFLEDVPQVRPGVFGNFVSYNIADAIKYLSNF